MQRIQMMESSSRASMEMIKTVDDGSLPGFRFHPTEDELLEFYLKKAVHCMKGFDIIGTLDLYRFEPWELPGMAKIGEREWYFFVPRVRKPTNGGRPSRTTAKGFWKATGSERAVRGVSDPKRVIGFKKTLVFYEGRAPHGKKSDWVMNEYRLPADSTQDMVLCKVYRKATSMKELEHRATMEEEGRGSRTSSTMDTFSSSSYTDQENLVVKQQLDVKEVEVEVSSGDTGGSLRRTNLPELEVEVPMMTGFEWSFQDSFLLRSPWSPYANLLNF